MQKVHEGKTRHKKIRSKVKWTVSIVLILAMGLIAEYARLELGYGTVTVTAPFRPQYSANTDPGSSIDLAKELIGVTEFAQQYSTTGSGQKVAVIDSGIDVNHIVFADNSDGTRKVAVYYDYTDEGILFTEVAVQEGDKVSLGGTQYRIGGIYNRADRFYMTFLELEALEPQSVDGSACCMAVLVTATGLGSTATDYDCVYIDTNGNCDFTDETPLYCYNNGGRALTVPHAGYPLTLAVTEITTDGRRVRISTDTLGHGTFLSSVIAANGDNYQGVAPEAQLYVYKIFDRTGASSQQKLANAIEQAIRDKVNCINLSLSIPKQESILPALSAALQRAYQAGIPIVAAAGNYGPGQDTIAYPAREKSVIGIGSIAYPEQYLLDRAVYLEQCIVPAYSGRGSIDNNITPFLVAPSGVIGAVPLWHGEEYLYDYGTSISAALTTGAICHIKEYIMSGAWPACATATPQILTALLTQWAQDMGECGNVQGYGSLQMGQMPNAISSVLPKQRVVQRIVSSPEFVSPYSIAQGQVQAWYLDIAESTNILEISFAVNSELAGDWPEHRIAMGRCRMYVYRPDGTLAVETEDIGASYGRTQKLTDSNLFRHPEAGVWEVVIASVDNLSLYQHFYTNGMLRVTTK